MTVLLQVAMAVGYWLLYRWDLFSCPPIIPGDGPIAVKLVTVRILKVVGVSVQLPIFGLTERLSTIQNLQEGPTTIVTRSAFKLRIHDPFHLSKH